MAISPYLQSLNACLRGIDGSIAGKRRKNAFSHFLFSEILTKVYLQQRCECHFLTFSAPCIISDETKVS